MFRIDYKVFLKCYPGEFLFYAVGILGGIVLLPSNFKGGFIIIISLVLSCVWSLSAWKNHFKKGIILPAVVVNPKKNLIAVLADFNCQGSRPYPVIKIVKRPISRAAGAPFKKAARLATVADFRNKVVSRKHWGDVYPVVVNCATANKKTIKRVLDMIEDEEWVFLIAALKQIKQPFRPGIYPVKFE